MNLLVLGHLSSQFPIPMHNNVIRLKASLQGFIPQNKKVQHVIWGKYNHFHLYKL
jgi:hypothetical protein